ncbi:MAG: enoyl-CoA hydratase-related protein [Dehalococcoidia bacterium]|jgi:enoyl-CoA hydratase
MPNIIYEKRNHVAYITINRPEAMNCVDPPTAAELVTVWQDFRDDNSAYVAVITGAGDKAFCAGFDLRTVKPGALPQAPHEVRRFVYDHPGLMGYTRKADIFKPIIAAVNGYCFAGGLEIALCADIRIAAENAEFGVLNRRWNVGLGDGGTQRLPRVVGLGRAMELIILGKRIDAQEAYRIGLANEVVPAASLMERVTAMAEAICQFPQGAVRTDKEAVMRGLGTPLEEGFRIEGSTFVTLLGQDDFYEGPRSFAEKRKPSFKQDD